MNYKKQIREEFKEAVFKRDNNKCVVCYKPAIDAHHIIDRPLWPDGGYHVDNGVSLCEEHHIDAEGDILTCDMLRLAANITNILLPPQLDPNKKYNKWGREIGNNPLAARIRDFLKKYVGFTEDDEYTSPDAYELEYIADLLDQGKVIKDFPFSTWESGGYHPYTSEEGRKEHDSILDEVKGLIV